MSKQCICSGIEVHTIFHLDVSAPATPEERSHLRAGTLLNRKVKDSSGAGWTCQFFLLSSMEI